MILKFNKHIYHISKLLYQIYVLSNLQSKSVVDASGVVSGVFMVPTLAYLVMNLYSQSLNVSSSNKQRIRTNWYIKHPERNINQLILKLLAQNVHFFFFISFRLNNAHNTLSAKVIKNRRCSLIEHITCQNE